MLLGRVRSSKLLFSRSRNNGFNGIIKHHQSFGQRFKCYLSVVMYWSHMAIWAFSLSMLNQRKGSNMSTCILEIAFLKSLCIWPMAAKALFAFQFCPALNHFALFQHSSSIFSLFFFSFFFWLGGTSYYCRSLAVSRVLVGAECHEVPFSICLFHATLHQPLTCGSHVVHEAGRSIQSKGGWKLTPIFPFRERGCGKCDFFGSFSSTVCTKTAFLKLTFFDSARGIF